MPLEYVTAQFENDSQGMRKRQIYLSQMSAYGWHVVSETIEQGQIKGGEACCLASICLPLGFLAGRTNSIVNMTFAREKKGGSIDCCSSCGKPVGPVAFCPNCGAKLKHPS